ncbi:MAG: hypothetical protein DI530_17000 [Sphingomonas sp.]|uniref:hypothetical protein n=1 Tax=Sphingomonas sp. TaxID=28214 RepID=UPI000DBBCC9B|nr:hypothetical protein [Sphingomonas sp.]PZU73884.1 MAG: hypothetical protein DI530_17000 [Sphingomonas sp.]
MEHPILVATIGSPAGQQSWSAISPDAVGSLHIDTRVSVENGVDLVVRRDLRDGSGNIHHSIIDFSHACGDEVSAGVRLEAARQLNDSDALIGKAFLLLGADWFIEHVESAAARLWAERVAADREAIEQAELDAALARQIDVYFKGSKTEPRIELRRGNSKAAIWSITFGEAWERDRFWDWLKWQRPRFHDFVEVLEGSDATTLRSRLLREMIETEQAARKNKLATTGRRPLRFWCGEVA